ncbi:nuclear transport factor 2 family protein [candidate division KSB1 bacterium]|nr:nuclear transport factor 2 family protein [candidate division KSB1 bacterium]
MSPQENTAKVQAIFAAFGRGDVQFILNNVTDDVDWQTLGPAIIPQAGPHKGRAEVGKFFEKVGQSYDFTQFEPREFVAQNDSVFAIVDYAAHVKKAGKSHAAQVAMLFVFKEGKVAKFREYGDTAGLVAALS